MGKYGTLGAVLAVIVGFLIYYSVGFTGDVQDNAIIEPVNATMTVGEMRITPHGGSEVDDDDSKPQGSKGVRAQDFVVEVTNELLKNKPENTVYLIDWKFVTRDEDGNEQEIEDATHIVNGALEQIHIDAGLTEEDLNPVIIEAEYTVNRYDSTQVKEDGSVRDEETPVNSTKYKWGIYTDEKARTGQPLGLGGEQSSIDFNLYGNNTKAPSGVTDYDSDGVSNTDAVREGKNPYGYVRNGDGEGEVDFATELDRDTLGED